MKMLALLVVVVLVAVYAPQDRTTTMHNVTHHVRHRNGTWTHFTRHEVADARVVEVTETEI